MRLLIVIAGESGPCVYRKLHPAVSRQMSHCYFPIAFLTQAPVPFLHVADFKDVRRGWDLRDTQAADANGHAVVVWLGASLAGNSNDRSTMEKTCSDGTNSCWAQWNVYMAETVDGHDLVPAFTQFTASDHIIHAGTVSTGGLGGGANRNLADFFQVALDPQHRANISFADDHIASPECTSQSPGHCADNDPQSYRTGQPYFTYQLKANPNIVPAASGQCSTTPPAPPGFEKMTGGGGIPSVKAGLTANFGFVAQNDKPNASLSYHDDGAPGGAIDAHSVNTSVPTVTFSGNCGRSKATPR